MGFPTEFSEQIHLLAAQFGDPVLHHAVLPGNRNIHSKSRIAEVCMVVRNIQGKIYLMRKPFYPKGIFRIHTGGIEKKETIIEAFHRELFEETGLLEPQPHFAAAISYADSEESEPSFFTFAFITNPTDQELISHDDSEHIEELRLIDIQDLPNLATQLSGIGIQYSKDADIEFQSWGIFRSVAVSQIYRFLTR